MRIYRTSPLPQHQHEKEKKKKTSRPPLVLRAPGSAGINPSLFFPSPKIDFNGLSSFLQPPPIFPIGFFLFFLLGNG